MIFPPAGIVAVHHCYQLEVRINDFEQECELCPTFPEPTLTDRLVTTCQLGGWPICSKHDIEEIEGLCDGHGGEYVFQWFFTGDYNDSGN